jgi:hypothetical protein
MPTVEDRFCWSGGSGGGYGDSICSYPELFLKLFVAEPAVVVHTGEAG